VRTCGASQRPELLGLRIVNSFEGRDRRGGNLPPRYNAAPSQELWAIRQHPETGERTLDLLKWGLILWLVPRGCRKEAQVLRSLNARSVAERQAVCRAG
jgi:putative SOS response-associated peptidase YedK